MLEEDFFRFYHPNQIGGSVGTEPFYQSSLRRQRGAGIGGFFGAIGRRLLPFLQKHVLPSAMSAVRNVADDLLDGRNLKESIKEHGIDAIKGVGKSVLNQSGSGFQRKRRKRTKTLRKSTKRSRLTIQRRRRPVRRLSVQRKRRGGTTRRKSGKIEKLRSIFD